jgi:hypothetical protein
LAVKARIVVGVHPALESPGIGGSVEEARSNAQRTNLIARCPRSTDLIGLAIHVSGSMVEMIAELKL